MVPSLPSWLLCSFGMISVACLHFLIRCSRFLYISYSKLGISHFKESFVPLEGMLPDTMIQVLGMLIAIGLFLTLDKIYFLNNKNISWVCTELSSSNSRLWHFTSDLFYLQYFSLTRSFWFLKTLIYSRIYPKI